MTVDDAVELLALVNPPMAGMIRASNVTMRCPFAAVSGHSHQVDRTPSLGIKPDDEENGGTWNCLACGRKGPVEHFFRLLERELGYDCSKALERLAALLYQDPEAIAASVPPFESHFAGAAREPYRIFPESWLAPYQGRVAQMLLDRGVTLETCRAWGLGFDRKTQRIIYPVRDAEGKLVGTVGGATRLMHEHDVKYKNLWSRIHSCGFPLESHNNTYRCESCGGIQVDREHAQEGFRKAKHLFGAHWFRTAWDQIPGATLKVSAVAVIVEGVVDALMVWQATRNFHDALGFPVLPLALLGSSPSQEQANLLVRLTADRRIVSFLDNDQAGRKGDRELYELVGCRVRFHRVRYGDNQAGADPGGMAAEAIREAIQGAQVILKDTRE